MTKIKKCISQTNFYDIYLQPVLYFLVKPYIVGMLIYIIYIIIYNQTVNKIEFFLMLFFICNSVLFIENLFYSFSNYFYNFNSVNLSLSDFICNMMENNDNTNNNSDNGNNNGNNNVSNLNIGRFDYSLLTIATLITYLSDNISILLLQRPFTNLMSQTIVNASMVILDLTSFPQIANYWIDEYNHYIRTGSLRVEEPGGPIPSIYLEPNPFARVSETNNPPLPAIEFNNNFLEFNNNLIEFNNNFLEFNNNFLEFNNNFLPIDYFNINFDFIRGLLTPVEHSLSLETLINVHTFLHLSLLLLVLILIILTIYLYLNLLILLNKEYLIRKIKNKYLLLYIKFVIFRTGVDILLLGILTLFLISFMFYILHYLIIHPIIIN